MADMEEESSSQQKKAKFPCLRCRKNVAKNSKSVRCRTCHLWVHVDCEPGISTELYNILAHPERFGGQVSWTCDSCVASNAKIEQVVKAYTDRINEVEKRMACNENSVKELDRRVEKLDEKVKNRDENIEKRVQQSELNLLEEINEREYKRNNVIMYKVKELEDDRASGRDRQDWDMNAVLDIVNSIGMRIERQDVKFLRRLGEAGRDPRPLCIGFHTEGDKNWLLRRGRELEKTRYKDVNVCPDLTRKQRQAEQELKKEAERRNEALSDDDISKNLKWAVVGAKGQKRLVKTTAKGPGRVEAAAPVAPTQPPVTNSTSTYVKRPGHRQQHGQGGTKRPETQQEPERGGGPSGPARKEINILYSNAQSLTRKIDELSCLAHEKNPDLILITESWANDEISNAYLTIAGYEVIPDLRMDRQDTTQGRGGGLVVYAKNGITVEKIENHSSHIQYCGFKVSGITIYLVYRSPNANPESLTELVSLVKNVKKDSYLIGDFNLPDVNWEAGTASGRCADFLEAVNLACMDQLVTFSTQVRGNILDLVLTNAPERVKHLSGGGRLGGSDHEIIDIRIECKGENELVKEVKNWRRADWDRMRREMSNVNWTSEFRNCSAGQMWRKFKHKVNATIKKNVPLRKVYKNSKPPWLTPEVRAAIRRKENLWKQAKRGHGGEEYKEAARRLKKLIRAAKNKHERRLADNKEKDKRPFYAYVRGKTRCRPEVGPLKTAAGETVTCDEQAASTLNNYFSSVFTQEDVTEIPAAEDQSGGARINSIRITQFEVKKKIRKLRTAAASGPDEIGPRVLQELINEVAGPLTAIFRASIATGDVPDDWRRANVTPIHKKGSKSDPANYRPVSLTSVSCKVLESILKDRIMDHLENNNLLSATQHGFRGGKSCATNLIEFLNEITAAVDKGEPVDVVFLDFAKAFDKVPKKRLAEKMRAHGIGGNIWQWICNWLDNRQQRVVINGRASSWKEVLSGVPQGSVLGPLLFLIYINDLDAEATRVSILRKFADDTKLGQSVADRQGPENLQKTLDNMTAWADRWGMAFNVSKCKVMHIGHNNKREQYYMNGEPLESTEEEKDVGVTMTKLLKPSAHCLKAAKTAQAALAQIGRSFHFRDRHVFTRLYKQYVRPHLEFASPAWSPWLEADIKTLEEVQKRAVRMVSGLESNVYEDRLRELGLTTLEERRHQADMAQVYKILTGKDRTSQLFEMAASSERATRAATGPLNIRVPTSRLEIRRNFFTNRVPVKWNQVPATIKQSATVDGFKSQYQAHRRALLGTAN